MEETSQLGVSNHREIIEFSYTVFNWLPHSRAIFLFFFVSFSALPTYGQHTSTIKFFFYPPTASLIYGSILCVCVCFLFINFSEKAPARTPLLSLLVCDKVAFLVPYCSWPSLMIYPPESNPKPACLRTTAYSTGGSNAKQMHMLYRKTLTASKIGKGVADGD